MINNNFNYEIDCENQEVGDLDSNFQIDGSVSRFKMPTDSLNATNKQCLEDASVGKGPIKVAANYSYADGDILTNLNEIVNNAFARLESALDRHVFSIALHLKDNKKVDAYQ